MNELICFLENQIGKAAIYTEVCQKTSMERVLLLGAYT